MREHDFIYIANGARGVVVRSSEIAMLEQEANYTRVTLVNGESFVVRCTMRKCEEELDSRQFFRVSRERLVNLACVKEVSPFDAKRLTFLLTNGKEIILSRLRSLQLRREYSL